MLNSICVANIELHVIFKNELMVWNIHNYQKQIVNESFYQFHNFSINTRN